MEAIQLPQGFHDAMQMPLIEALLGRRARRFLRGAAIPDGPFAFQSTQDPLPLTELEKLLVLSAMGGNTGWNYLLMHNLKYAPHLPNYSGAAGGRTFPSSAGFHTSEIFYTDDNGIYVLQTRDAPALIERNDIEPCNPEDFINAQRQRIRKLSGQRLHLPPHDPHVEGHNHWVANRPGSLLAIPVADVAQHHIGNLCYYLQNGYCLYDNVHNEKIPGLEKFGHLHDSDNLLPMSFIEHYSLMECTAELSTACYAGVLMLQAMGLGGWMYNGINPFSILGASGDPEVPGLGFRYDSDDGWSTPNPTGLPDIFEGFCPPHYPNMRAAVEAFVLRKFGNGGPFYPETPGPWKDTKQVRKCAQVHSEEFKECVTLQAQYTLDRFGKFPGIIPSILAFIYLQAHHLDLEFYDKYFEPGAYLETHARHMERWHHDTE